MTEPTADPTQTSATNPSPNPAPTPQDDLTAKLEQARRALEGEQWTAKREHNEQVKVVESQLQSLQSKLAEIATQKEALELAWIDLDTQRKTIRNILNPILTEEKAVEAEEAKLETEEASIGVESEKVAVEERRWSAQSKRRELEMKKKGSVQQLAEIDKIIETNTAKYRQLLDEEDKLNAQLNQLKAQATSAPTNN